MKKLLSLLLCIVFVCLTLVGCAQDVIGEYLENYDNNKKVNSRENLNFYIITEDATSAEAKITVPQNINAYLKEKYEIELNITYCSAAEYESVVLTALENTDESKRPDIVLVNSKSMFDTLYENKYLASLHEQYNSIEFKRINAIIDKSLLAASSVPHQETGETTFYTVPNNHLIGEYKYIVIDKSMARDTLHFSNAEIAAMTDASSLAELVAALETYYESDACTSELSKEEFVNANVKIVSGTYADKLLLEYGVTASSDITKDSVVKNIVNVNSYPNATAEEAFSSAFAVVRHLNDQGTEKANGEDLQGELRTHYNACMRIIYALNNDAQFKNMLQYGYVGTNYRFIKNEKNENTNYIRLEKGAEVVYQMNPIYTGNIFNSYYCEELGWNETVYDNIIKQNADAKTPSQKLNADLASLTLATTANADTVLNLPAFGSVYSDVTISWTSSNTDVAVVNENGTLTFVQPEAATKVTVTATLSCAGATLEKTFEIKVS